MSTDQRTGWEQQATTPAAAPVAPTTGYAPQPTQPTPQPYGQQQPAAAQPFAAPQAYSAPQPYAAQQAYTPQQPYAAPQPSAHAPYPQQPYAQRPYAQQPYPQPTYLQQPPPGPWTPAGMVPLTPTKRHGWWWKTLAAGVLLWVLTVVVTYQTLNANLVPTVILLGSFVVPFSVALFAAERVRGIAATQVVMLFAVGGVFGVLGASLLESGLTATWWVYGLVGLIEEGVKAAIVVLAVWNLRPRTFTQGALLGATVGAGFAAFESAGYAFTTAISSQGISLQTLIETEVVRALLSPVGHVLWTALLGGVLVHAARHHRRLRLSASVAVTFVGVALLHALWDSAGSVATWIAYRLEGQQLQGLRYGGMVPADLVAELSRIAMTYYVIGLIIVAALGIGAFTLAAVRAHRVEREEHDATFAALTSPLARPAV